MTSACIHLPSSGVSQGGPEKVDHPTAGAQEAERLAATPDDRMLLQVIARAVAGHHGGLSDTLGDEASLKARLKKDTDALDPSHPRLRGWADAEAGARTRSRLVPAVRARSRAPDAGVRSARTDGVCPNGERFQQRAELGRMLLPAPGRGPVYRLAHLVDAGGAASAVRFRGISAPARPTAGRGSRASAAPDASMSSTTAS